MKKTYLIIGGVTAILLLVAIWVYLLIYGTPKTVEQFFADFTFSGTSDNTPIEPLIPPETEAQVDIDTTKLRQLTTRPVIGMGEYTKGEGISKITYIRYAEAGTGHIYAINIITGEETRISNATIAGANKAKFSPNGKYVAFASGYTNQPTITLLTLSESGEVTKTNVLTQKMVDFTFSDTNELLYTEYSNSGQIGRALNPETLVGRTLFTIPFQSATVNWSADPNTPHYVYTKASAKLSGYLYSLINGQIKRKNSAGFGLTALANEEYVVITSLQGTEPTSYSMELSTDKKIPLPLITTPEKCVFTKIDTAILFCGYEQKSFGYEFPDNWYKGLMSFADNIYLINIKTGQSSELMNIKSMTGRDIDIITMNISKSDRMLYFINKNDNTLWMYEI